jgi:hypothetical protein
VRVFLKFLWYEDPNSQSLIPYWHVTLRYSDGGNDIWSVDPVDSVAEGYPPIEGTGWVFFLMKKDSTPYLYFQPQLIVMEQNGIRTSGVYFRLFDQP